MKRVLTVAALLTAATTAKTAHGFVSIQAPPCTWTRSRRGSIVISNPAIPSYIIKHGDDPLITRLYATNKKRKQGSTLSSNNSGTNGFGFNNAKSKSIVKTKSSSLAPDVSMPPKTQQPRIRALKQLSTEPLIFTIDDFVSHETCQALMQQNDASNANNNKHSSLTFEEARLNFASLVASELFQGQWGKNDGLRFNKSSSSDANNKDETSMKYSPFQEGLHVDTNNGSIYRSVTLILYLNDIPVECGGATVFPLAGLEDGDELVEASARLLKGGIGHTRGRAAGEVSSLLNDEGDGGGEGVLLPSQEADALLLEQQTSSQRGIWVEPQAGRLCIFFSRTGDGEIDPRSWHGGERLIGGRHASDDGMIVGNDDRDCIVTDKHILTLFKEVSYGTSSQHPEEYDTTSLEDYLAPQIAEQREALQVLAQSHAGFFI